MQPLFKTVCMEYNRIISVTGLGGLFELVSSKNDGAIVRGLEDKATRFVSSRVHNFSHLESIEVYTNRENVNLVDIFKAMQASSEVLPAEKDAAAVKTYFEKVYPDMDFTRVYASDMKKMVKWFSALISNGVEIKLSEAPAEEEETATDESAAAVAAVAETAPETPAAEAEVPKKKTTRKKKADEKAADAE